MVIVMPSTPDSWRGTNNYYQHPPLSHSVLFGLTLEKNHLGMEWGSGSDTVFDTKLCFNLSSWLPGIFVCKSSTSLGLIFIICKKRADAEPGNVQDLSSYVSWL